MSHEDCLPGSPADWLRHAYSDLELARRGRLSPDILLEELCFHAQQTVEKSLIPLPEFNGLCPWMPASSAFGEMGRGLANSCGGNGR